MRVKEVIWLAIEPELQSSSAYQPFFETILGHFSVETSSVLNYILCSYNLIHPDSATLLAFSGKIVQGPDLSEDRN